MARYILTPFGGPGETRPFFWLANLLRERGHVVKLLGASNFAETADAAGCDYTSVGNDEYYREFVQESALGDREKAARLTLQFGTRTMRRFHEAICLALTVEPAVLVAPAHHLAARAVKDKYRVPLVGVHFQPDWSDGMAGAGTGGEDWLLAPFRGMGWHPCAHTTCMTTAIAPAVLKFCAEIGIAPPRQGLRNWAHPPDLNIMLFPRWFSGAHPDSPANFIFDGFPPAEPFGRSVIPTDLRKFLETGEQPVLLTLESDCDVAQTFFETGLRACAMLGLRALVMTAHHELLPQPLPSWAFAIGPCSVSGFLSSVHAVVHDGDTSMLSQCLGAGTPQLVMPTLRDQKSNAARVRWLGTGESIMPALFSVDNVAAALLRLSSNRPVKTACKAIRHLCHGKTAGPVTLAALENFASQRTAGSTTLEQVHVIEPGPGLLAK